MSPKLVLAAVSAATSIVGGVMAKRSFDAAADVEEQELLRVNDLDRMRDAEDFDRVEAQTQLALSHNGWLTNSGSAALIQIANADEFEEQQIMNDYAMRVGKDKQIEGAVQDRMRGELESMTGQARGAALRAQGRQALLGGAMKAGSIGMSVKT